MKEVPVSPLEVPVLIAGAGPAGLAAAVTLARHGVESLVVERRPTLSSHPRATTVSTRTMEIVRSWGLEEDVLAGGVDVDWLLMRTPSLARAAEGEVVEVGIPTRAQAALVSPSAPACLSQEHLERAMAGHLAALGGGVAHATELAGVALGPDGVAATLRTAAGEREVRAAHLVAADGARSGVRSALGIAMDGSDDLLGAVTALFRAPLWDVLGEHRYGIYAITDPEEPGTFLPWAPGDHWGFGYLVDTSAGEPPLPAPAAMAARIRRAAGIPRLPVEMGRMGSFSSSARIAERFREGPAFLVGDAAHRVTPRGGTGMNTAFADGYDLGWRLAWVLKGWAGDDLLDGYERERRPVAEHNVARSADPDGSARPSGEELRVDLGGRIPHQWVSTPAGRASTLDLLGPGLTLLTGPDDAAWRHAADAVDSPPPLAVRGLDELAARSLGIRAGGAALVRSDGVPVETWPARADTAGALAGAIADLAAPGRRAPAMAA